MQKKCKKKSEKIKDKCVLVRQSLSRFVFAKSTHNYFEFCRLNEGSKKNTTKKREKLKYKYNCKNIAKKIYIYKKKVSVESE